MRTAATLTKSSATSYKKNLMDIYKKPAAQVSTALILTVFAIIFFAAFAIRPTLATIVELNKKIEDQKEVVEKLEKKATALATAQSEYLLIEDKIPLVEAAIPKTHSLDTLLKQIEGIAASINVPINSIQVDEIVFPEEAPNIKKDGAVVSLPLSITLSSQYGDIKEFMNLLSKIKRLVTIESVSFSSDLNNEVGLKMSLAIKTYHLPGDLELEK